MEPVYFVTKEELEELLDRAAARALDRFIDGKRNVYLTRDEVARRLGVAKSTLWRWDKAGYLRATRIGAKCVYPEDIVVSFEKKDKMA